MHSDGIDGLRTVDLDSGAMTGAATRCAAFLTSSLLVVAACLIYRYAPFSYQRLQFSETYGGTGFAFSGGQFLFAAASLYIAALAIYYAREPGIGTPKALLAVRFGARFLRSPRAVVAVGPSMEERTALLTLLLKAFFGPMMVMSLLRFCQGALSRGEQVLADGGWGAGFVLLLTEHAFWFAMSLILFVDVLWFTAGYLVETPRLRNVIRSVDPTLLGWAAALLCYPPFNSLTGAVLGSKVSDFPRFDDPTTHVVLNGVLLALMAVYAWASVALGWKASNLTHRGIVASGPYRFLRHPAYTCKNVAWWIGSIPLVTLAFRESTLDGLLAVASVMGWTLLYVLRALTEEDHLKRVDDEYDAYAARVRWRFIPGIV